MNRGDAGLVSEENLTGDVCRREFPREPVSLAASAVALGCSRSVIISDLSPSGAQLDARGLPPPGDDLLMVAGSFETFATVVWRTDERCGIHFDDAVPANDLACMKKEASWMSVAGWYR
jgi:hypothetical protein